MRAIINAMTVRAGWGDPKLDVFEQVPKAHYEQQVKCSR
jgi:hypothetical protein